MFGAADSQGDQVSASERVAAGSRTATSATMDIPKTPNLVTATVVELGANGSPTGVSVKCNLTKTNGPGSEQILGTR